MKIGLFIGDMCQNYQQIIMKSLEAYAKEKEISIYVFGSFVTPGNNILHAEGEKSIIYLPKLSTLDGIICAGDTINHFGMEQELVDYLSVYAVCPVVSLRSYHEEFYNILIDNENAIYEMTKHFLEKGKKEICFVTGKIEMQDAQERFAGYKKAMAEAQIPISEDDIFYGNYWKNKSEEIIDAFFAKRRKKPEVIICSNDYEALGLYETLKKQGIRIPEDVCLSGFDDVIDAQLQETSLTSVRVPFDEMARTAVDMIMDLAQGKNVPREKRMRTINCYRDSCGCVDEHPTINKMEFLEKSKHSWSMAKENIYMATEFEGALNEQECIEWAANYFCGLDVKRCFICMCPDRDKYDVDKNICLRYYLDEDGKSAFVNEAFRKSDLLPTRFLHIFECASSIFLPLHCKNEIYGYIVIQMKEGEDHVLDERFEFLNLTFGNALKKNYMYYELFAVNDIVQLYLQDPLTEIYNRRGFDRQLVELHQTMRKGDGVLAMVSIDMDGLKYINDSFGHAEGDKALKAFSNCLKNALNENEVCARIGGDEFTAALIINEPKRAEEFKKKLDENISAENKMITKNYRLDYSIGICRVKDRSTFMECMHKADERMYKNKRSKLNKQGGCHSYCAM